jgi:hypothetical protein
MLPAARIMFSFPPNLDPLLFNPPTRAPSLGSKTIAVGF